MKPEKIERLPKITPMTDVLKHSKEIHDKVNELIEIINLQQEQIQRLRESLYGGVR